MPIRSYAASTSFVQIATGDALGKNGFLIYNNSTGAMEVSFVNGTGELLGGRLSFPLPPSGTYENFKYLGNVFAKWPAAQGSGFITEF
jgi:hypothetical protein